jgi:hypothetical protein
VLPLRFCNVAVFGWAFQAFRSGFMGIFGQSEPQPVRVSGLPLKCEICKHDRFWKKSAQLNTAVATFFNFDWANPTATCYVCAGCGYVHWFLPIR